MAPRKKATEAAEVGQEDKRTIAELGSNAPVERVAENDFATKVEEEEFANQLLTVLVHPDNVEGSLPIICVSVNEMDQYFIRGQEVKVKRKYVEVLARTRFTGYKQVTPDSGRPELIQMVATTVLSYPFAVIDDPHPNGREWLKAILAEK